MAIRLTDGNAFAIIGAGRRELVKQGRLEELPTFMEEVTSGDYDQVLQTMLRWFPDLEVA